MKHQNLVSSLATGSRIWNMTALQDGTFSSDIATVILFKINKINKANKLFVTIITRTTR